MQGMETDKIENRPHRVYDSGMAGKPKKPENLKSETIQIRVTPRELKALQKMADKARLALATWMRTVCLAKADEAEDAKVK